MEAKEAAILWAKMGEIVALTKKDNTPCGTDPARWNYFSGKAQAFSEIWEYLLFKGRSVPAGTVHPQEYNRANELWSKMAIDALEAEKNNTKTYIDDGSGKLHDKTPDLSDYDGMMVEKQPEKICQTCKSWCKDTSAWGQCENKEVGDKVANYDLLDEFMDVEEDLYFHATFGCIHWEEKKKEVNNV